MFHNFTIYANSELLKSISRDINNQGLRSFLSSLEYSNDKLLSGDLETGSINTGFFMLSELCTNKSINISIASRKNSFILMDIFSGISKQYNVNVEYNFYCTKEIIVGKASLIDDSYSFKKYADFGEICNDISYSLLEPCLIEMLSSYNIISNDLKISSIESKEVNSFGMGYIENKYEINIGENSVFYTLSLDKIISFDDICPSRIIHKDGETYIASSIGWSRSKNFDIEGSAQDMDKDFIIKSLFNIKSIIS